MNLPAELGRALALGPQGMFSLTLLRSDGRFILFHYAYFIKVLQNIKWGADSGVKKQQIVEKQQMVGQKMVY